MTSPKPQKRRLKVDPDPGGRLEQLLIQNKESHDSAVSAGEAESDLKAAIKAFFLNLFPGGEGLPDAFDIAADPHGRYPAYTMTLKGGSHLDTERMKAEAMATYESYLKPSKPSWELRESGGGRK